MKIGSFHLKIALTSLLLSGVSLCIFGLIAWIVSYQMGLDRIDREITSWGRNQLSKYRVSHEWGRFEEDMNLVFGRHEETDSIILLVKDRSGETVYQSDNWPSNLSSNQYPSHEDMKIPESISPLNFRDSLKGTQPFLEDESSTSPEVSSSFDQRWNAQSFLPPSEFTKLDFAGHTWCIGVMANEYVTMVLGVSLNNFISEMHQIRRAFLIALPAALFLIAAAGWLVSRRALRPVRIVTETAKRITGQGLDQRIPAKTADHEFQELISVLNRMFERLETNFHQATRFSADAAHELQTPLTILQGELEQALRDVPPESPYQHVFQDLMGEVLRLKAIMQKLLLLSKADAGQLNLRLETIDLIEVVEELIEDISILAPHLTIQNDLLPKAFIQADAELIRQALQNLVSNAIKYNRPNGLILLRVNQSDNQILFTIANTGSPIPQEDRKKIFDRFFRTDESRGRHVDGTGLGLNLAREIVNALNGCLTLDESKDEMISFTVVLPKA